MEYILTPYTTGQESCAYWDDAFSTEQLNWLQNKAKNSNDTAQVGMSNQGVVDSNLRRTAISWLKNTPESNWVYEIFGHVVSSLNAQFFKFDLTGFGEAAQLANYDSSIKGTYGWHTDAGPGIGTPSRKLSIVLQLSDPSEFEGGNLELMAGSEKIIKVPKRRGLIIAFPSWTLHQVTPVTQGTRQSLVLWTTGPSFK